MSVPIIRAGNPHLFVGLSGKVNGQTKFFIMLCSDMIVIQLQHKIIFPVHLQVKELPTRPFSGKGCVRA